MNLTGAARTNGQRSRGRALAGHAGPVLATISAIALLAGLGLFGAQTRGELRAASQKTMNATELCGTIAQLDEALALLARMATLTGERHWAQRFEELAPKLDGAIAEAGVITTPEIRAALAETTDEAHRDLLMVERRALALAADGDLAAARALLDGPEFGYLQEVYASGLDVFGQQVKAFANARTAELDARAWLEAGGLGVIAALLVATALALRGHLRLRSAMARNDAIARTDLLTDLPNRRRFYEALGAALAEAGEHRDGPALLLVNLDRFKAANDAHGHAAGDRLLQITAARLRHILHDGNLVARLGGDVFAVLVRAGPPTDRLSLPDAAHVAKRVVAALGESMSLNNGLVVRIGASIGIAVPPPGSVDIDALMQQAEVALRRAKADGRGCFRCFAPGMDADMRARALLEGELRQAVADEAVVPHFQPLVDLDTGRVVGVEMLARWPHPTRGTVSPAEFIPIAEDIGLIGPLTVNLLRRGCRAAANWPAYVTLACNVSALQLHDTDLPATIAAVLAETGFPANRLEVEVTESALVGDLALARELLDQLRNMGVRLALDDFGTGYSSLRHLQALPFDTLKVDQSFVAAMVADRDSAEIVAAVVELGHSLGLSVVAEGIETEEVMGLLRGLGCDVGQGWLFGRPLPAERIDALLRTEAATALVA